MDVDGIVLPPPDDHLSGMIWRGKEEKNDGSTDALMSVEARLQASGPILQQKHIGKTFPLCSEVTAAGSIGRTGTDGSTPIGLNFAGTLACKACTSVQV